MKSLHLSLTLSLAATASLFAQIPDWVNDTATEKGVPAMFHCGDREDLKMSPHDRRCYWWTHSFNAQMIVGAAFNSALDPFFNSATSAYWGQGVEGFSKRFGTRVAQSMTKGSSEALVDAIFHEDPRFFPSRKQGFGPRFGFALKHTFVVRHDNGKEYLSAGRIAGTFSSGFIGMAWTPDPINSPREALVRSGTAWAGILASSLFKEFQPDLMKLISAIFRRPPKA